MEGRFFYPGTFCPPTYGHLAIAHKAAELCGEITIVCSENPEKGDGVWFTPEECKELWRTYDLPANIRVATLTEILVQKTDFTRVVMVRGVRDDQDFEYEKKVMMDNYRGLGIDKFLVLVSEEKFRLISSTRARAAAAADARELDKMVSPAVAEKLRIKVRPGLKA